MGSLHLFAALTLFMIAVVVTREHLPRHSRATRRQAEFAGALIGLALAVPYLLILG